MFQTIFRSGEPARDKFLSRLFGIFNEDIVRCWANSPQSPYEDLGRPTLKRVGEAKLHTLDFALRSRNDGRVFVAEMKCELAYENYRYLTLESPSQLNHHKKEAFRVFIDSAKSTSLFTLTVKTRPQLFHGAVLIWGSMSEQGRMKVMAQYGFEDVLSVEHIISDLMRWQNKEYADLIFKYERWSTELYKGLSLRA